MSAAVAIRDTQERIVDLLGRFDGFTFGELFERCGFTTAGRVNGTSHERILDRALQGLRRHGDIHFNKKRGLWMKVAPENVTRMPMTWEVAHRLVANVIGVPDPEFEAWVAEAAAMPEGDGEKWLSDRMFRAVQKQMMRTLP